MEGGGGREGKEMTAHKHTYTHKKRTESTIRSHRGGGRECGLGGREGGREEGINTYRVDDKKSSRRPAAASFLLLLLVVPASRPMMIVRDDVCLGSCLVCCRLDLIPVRGS